MIADTDQKYVIQHENQRLNVYVCSSIAREGLVKVEKAISNRQEYNQRQSHHCSSGWLLDMLSDYDVTQLSIPYPSYIKKKDMSVLMTLDPALSYSMYRPLSDGLITDKTNLTIRGVRYAVVLALIGAARFLRAQRVAQRLVNFYLPLADSLVLYPETLIG